MRKLIIILMLVVGISLTGCSADESYMPGDTLVDEPQVAPMEDLDPLPTSTTLTTPASQRQYYPTSTPTPTPQPSFDINEFDSIIDEFNNINFESDLNFD